MKLLITGANGLLGQKLVQLVADKGIPLLASSLGPSRIQTPGVDYVPLDITDRASILQTVADYGPTAIVHAAAMTQVDQCETDRKKCWELNVMAVAHMIEAAAKTAAHLIHLSTDFIFDGTSGPYEEDAQPNPVNYYGQSKWAAEKLLLESNIKWSIARTILVYGSTPGSARSNIMLWVKRNLESGNPIRVVADQFRTPTLVDDLAMGCYLIAEKTAEGIFHISGKDLLTPYDIAIITARYFSLDESLITKTDSDEFKQTAPRPLRTGFIIEKAKRLLGYQPHSFEDGLAITASNWS